MPSYVTPTEVRAYVGISTAEISDDDLDSIILDTVARLEKELNTKFAPTLEIEVRDGNRRDTMFTNRGPLLGLRAMKIDGTAVTISDMRFDATGKIQFYTSSGTNSMNFLAKPSSVVLKYLYGKVEADTLATTTSSAAVTAGTSVSISCADITKFNNGDWVEIYGMDGFREVAQINAAPGAGAIVVDQLLFSHESGSTVNKLVLNARIKQLIKIEACLMMVARFIGQSYDDVVGYNIGTFQVQKGEPYTQWRETASQLLTQRAELRKRLYPFPAIN